MFKNYVFIVFVFLLKPCFSQNNSGVITYKKDVLKYLSDNKEFKKKEISNPEYYNNVLKIDENVKQLLENLEFNLIFKGDESIFKVHNFLEIENNKYYGFAIGPEGSNIYYANKKNKENIRQVDAYGDLFLVDYPVQEWELSSETKQIGAYTCYKARTIKTVKGRKGIIKTPVEVWYTPEIAIPFGPIGYGGLPGLVMELSMNNYRYYVIKIELNPKNEIIIKKPTQGKKVTEEDFREIGKKAMESLKKGF
jgi:GLPGLI family protein